MSSGGHWTVVKCENLIQLLKDLIQTKLLSCLVIAIVSILSIKETWAQRDGKRESRPILAKGIIVIAVNAIGDYVLLTGMMAGLRQKYQGYRVTLVAYNRFRELAQYSPYFDHLIVFDRVELVRRPVALYRLIRAIRSVECEMVLYASYSRAHLGDLLVYACRAKRKIGFDGDSRNIGNRTKVRNNRFYTQLVKYVPGCDAREIDYYRYFSESIGADGDTYCPRIHIPAEREALVIRRLQKLGVGPEFRYVVLAPGAAKSARYWTSDGYAAVVGYLIGHGLTIVACGGRADEGFVAEIARQCGSGIVNLTGKTRLDEFAVICKYAQLFVGAESGPLQVAMAYNVPTVCIMGGGQPFRFCGFGDGTRHKVVFNAMECYGCDWDCIHDSVLCIKDITSRSVIKEIDALLAMMTAGSPQRGEGVIGESDSP